MAAAEESTGMLGKIDDSDEELGDAFDSDDDDGGEEDDDIDDDTEDGAAGGVEKKRRIASWVPVATYNHDEDQVRSF